MTVALTVQPEPLNDFTPRDSRPARSRRSDEHRDEALAGVSGVAFESLLSVTTRVVDAVRGRATEASGATQMFDAPAADARERRGRAVKSDDRTGLDPTAGDGRFDRTSVGARTARAAGASAHGSEPAATAQGRRPAASASRANAAAGSELQTRDLHFDASSGVEKTGDASARGESSAASTNRGGAAPLTMDARSAARDVGAAAGAVALTPTRDGGRIGNAPSNDAAQQVARILSGVRGGVESARAVDAASTANGGPSANTDSRTTNQSAQADDTGEARSPESNTASGKSGAAQRTMPFEELVRSIRLNAGARQSSATLQLDPPELGRLSVEIRIVADQAEIKVRTETPAARLLVRRRASELTDALERRGIHLERFDVTSDPPDPQPPAFATGNGSRGAITRRGYEGMEPTGRSGERAGLPGDGAQPLRGAVGGTNTVGHGVGAESRLDIRA